MRIMNNRAMMQFGTEAFSIKPETEKSTQRIQKTRGSLEKLQPVLSETTESLQCKSYINIKGDPQPELSGKISAIHNITTDSCLEDTQNKVDSSQTLSPTTSPK